MPRLSVIQVLHALDGGADEVGQAVALLEAAALDPLGLALGAGDRALVGLVAAVTGAPVACTAPCPACGEVNEVSVDHTRLDRPEPRSRWLGPGLGVREPTYGDLVDLPDDVEEAVAALGERCSHGPVPVDQAMEAIDEVDTSLAGPINVTCVHCGTGMVVDADIERLALQRLRDAAARADREVHLLASTYAWDLATIEALPDARRQRLARMVEDR